MHLKLIPRSIGLFAWIIASLSLNAQTTSPELERLQDEIAPYMLPAELGSKVIPSLKLEKASAPTLIETMKAHGVEIAISKSVSDAHWNIKLRNLTLNRTLEFITQQVGAHWLYQDGRVVIFRSKSELNKSYQKAFQRKSELEQQIQIVKSKLYAAQTREKAIVLKFKVSDATLPQILHQLAEATASNDLSEGKGINIVPLFDPRLYTETHSYSFSNQSLAHILNTICADQQMEWQAGENAITIDTKRN